MHQHHLYILKVLPLQCYNMLINFEIDIVHDLCRRDAAGWLEDDEAAPSATSSLTCA